MNDTHPYKSQPIKTQQTNNHEFNFSRLLPHPWTFALLTLLSLVNIEAISSCPLLRIEPLLVILAFTLLILKIRSRFTLGHYLKKYRVPFAFLALYFFCVSVSLGLNSGRFETLSDFFRWGIPFPASQVFLVLCVCLFFLSVDTAQPRFTGAPLFISVLLCVAALIQVNFNDAFFNLYRYSIAGGLKDSSVPRGLLATSTDLGAICGIVVICAAAFLSLFLRAGDKAKALAALVFLMLALVAGINSGSRVFYLAIITGSLSYWLLKQNSMRKRALQLLTLCFFVLALMLISPLTVAAKLSEMLPIIGSLSFGTPVHAWDILPSTSLEFLGDRLSIWSRAKEHIANNMLFGISNGGFRLDNQLIGLSPNDNTHNLLIQLAIDAGILGTLSILALSYLVFKNASQGWYIIFMASVLATLMVDNFSDHSFPWILFATYGAALMKRVDSLQPRALHALDLQFTNKQYISASVLSLSFIAGLSAFNRATHHNLPLHEQIARTHELYSANYWDEPPIFLSTNLIQKLNLRKRVDPIALFPILNSADCSKFYPDSKVIHLSHEVEWISNSTRRMGQEWMVSTIEADGCTVNKASQSITLEPRDWTSNHDRILRSTAQTNKSLYLDTDYASLFSPIILFNEKTKLTFTIHSTAVGTQLPQINVSVKDGISGETLVSRDASLLASTFSFTGKDLSRAPRYAFAQVRLKSWIRNEAERQSIRITNIQVTDR